jgi:hypothetical protein
MVQVKKASKYGKYFFFLMVAAIVSFFWPSKSGHTALTPSVPHAFADAPSGGIDSGDCDGGGGDGDCDS